MHTATIGQLQLKLNLSTILIYVVNENKILPLFISSNVSLIRKSIKLSPQVIALTLGRSKNSANIWSDFFTVPHFVYFTQ